MENLKEAAARLQKIVAAKQPVVLFLDYDGTLREIELEPLMASPTAELRALLQELVRQKYLDLFLVSGRSYQDLALFFPQPDFACVAEHGAAIRRAGHLSWERWDDGVNFSWKNAARDFLQRYVESTPASWIEEKRTGLVWHYRKSDTELGFRKARQLINELGPLMADELIRIRPGRKIVEISSAEISKTVAIRRLLREKNYGGGLCAGDDQTDEHMFEVEAPNFIAIKVGREPSRAPYRLLDPASFREFLRETFLERASTS